MDNSFSGTNTLLAMLSTFYGSNLVVCSVVLSANISCY